MGEHTTKGTGKKKNWRSIKLEKKRSSLLESARKKPKKSCWSMCGSAALNEGETRKVHCYLPKGKEGTKDHSPKGPVSTRGDP